VTQAPLIPEVISSRDVHEPDAPPAPQIPARTKWAIGLVVAILLGGMLAAVVYALTGWPFGDTVEDPASPATTVVITAPDAADTTAATEGGSGEVRLAEQSGALPIDATMPGELIEFTLQQFLGETDFSDAFGGVAAEAAITLEPLTEGIVNQTYVTEAAGSRFAVIAIAVLPTGPDAAQALLGYLETSFLGEAPEAAELGGEPGAYGRVPVEQSVIDRYLVMHDNVIFLVGFRADVDSEDALEDMVSSFRFTDAGIEGIVGAADEE
jgi:hypothetical protein